MLANISTQNLLNVILIVHLTIIVLIAGSMCVSGTNSLNKPITRGQLLIIILSIWFLLYCHIYRQNENEKFDSYDIR